MLPLSQHFQPGVEMKFDVVPRWSAEINEWDFTRDHRRGDRDERLPPEAGSVLRFPRVSGRARASQSVLSDEEIQRRN